MDQVPRYVVCVTDESVPASRLAHPHMKRVLRIVIGGVVIELALALLAHLAPAAAGLIRPVYWIVAGICLVGIAHALRKRSGHDRRTGQRRNG
jgi:hypothetical protein